MQANVNTNLERIIAKIDNDFNPDNSDWIPRVGAWCIDAMSMLDCLPTERKRKVLSVDNRIAYSDCNIDNVNIKVYDSKGCEVEEANKSGCRCNPPSTGEVSGGGGKAGADTAKASESVSIYTNNNPYGKAPDYLVAETINTDKEWPGRYRINEYDYGDGINKCKRTYVLSGCNQIELNFDDICITIEYDGIKTDCNNQFSCELPVIPNNGLLIEALVYFCMYKMLCRGYKHPVFNLNASQYGTNPYYLWTQIKEEARRSVIAGKVDTDDAISKLFRSNFYTFTFDSR